MRGQQGATLTAILTKNQPMARRGNNARSLDGLCLLHGWEIKSRGDLLDLSVAAPCGVLHPCRVTPWNAQMEKA